MGEGAPAVTGGTEEGKCEWTPAFIGVVTEGGKGKELTACIGVTRMRKREGEGIRKGKW